MLENILSSVRVLDLTQNVAGPYCTQILGDLGAEIIKVERPGSGDDTRGWRPPEIGGESSTFLAFNRNKKSICLDLGSDEGIEIARKLAKNADVIVHTMRPGSAEDRQLGYEHLSPDNAGLVYCAISAFGETGPMRALPGYDPLLQAFTGILSVTGNEGDDPARVSVSLIDMGTGMWAAMGILGALLERTKTGKGMRVEASLLATGMSWMTVMVASYLASGQLPRRMGTAMSIAAPYELFRTVDGSVFIAAGNDRLFAKVCEALDCTELAADPRFSANSDRVSNRAALHLALEARTSTRKADDCIKALRAVGAPCSEVHNVAQAIAHEQVQAAGMILDIPLPGAPQHKGVALPLSTQGKRSSAATPPPALGADTDAVLGTLGIDASDILRLRAAGVIG
jgi:crotonobetainyl-CoA:carnitine CoA-transferase CaiB-like acyl-CoA transferase